MRRAPARPVRACTLRKWCPVSHVTFEAPLRTSHFSLHSSQSSHSTLHTARFPLHSPHFTLHSPHFTLHTPHFTLHSSRPTLHTALFTLHTSSHLSPSHLIPAHLFSSLLICHLSFHESLPSTTSRTCMRRAPARPVRACFVRSCCSVAVQQHDLRATPVQCNAKQALSSHFTLRSSRPTLHTSHLHLISTHLI